MAKTYTALTVANATAGNAILASDFSSLFTNSNNYRVPPACQVKRTSNLTSYVADAAITWQAANYDTESPSDPMWSSGTNPERVTIRTAGIYMVVYKGYLTATATLSAVQPSIRKNGTQITDIGAYFVSTASLWSLSQTLSLAVGDYLTASVFISGGSAYAIGGTAGDTNTQTTLSATWLGQVS